MSAKLIEECFRINREQYQRGLSDKDRYLENRETILAVAQHGDKSQIETLTNVMRDIEKEFSEQPA